MRFRGSGFCAPILRGSAHLSGESGSGDRCILASSRYPPRSSPRPEVVHSSIKELDYHRAVLDAFGLDNTHKIVIHLGGIYQDKAASIRSEEHTSELQSRLHLACR